MKQSRKVVGLSSRLSHNPALTDLSRSIVTPSACQGRTPGPCSGATCYDLLDRPGPGDRSRRKESEGKKDAGDPNLEWNKGTLFMAVCAYILLYKEALGRKIKLSKNTEIKCITTATKGITIVKGP